jgi:hypothetical protein
MNDDSSKSDDDTESDCEAQCNGASNVAARAVHGTESQATEEAEERVSGRKKKNENHSNSWRVAITSLRRNLISNDSIEKSMDGRHSTGI